MELDKWLGRKDLRMASKYDPLFHIQPLAVGARDESVLDQREITVQSYQSTVPFNLEKLEAELKNAWLSPTIRFGLFSRLPHPSGTSATVVLGLQDELSVRAYDYDERRPLWFSWQNVIVDTVSVHYFCDEHGLLQFTATGGGRRITDDLLHEFNATFLGIPKGAVTKRHFDLEKLRALCFDRFIDRLYMLRFTGPSGDEYRTIDHAQFQSRKYIDPHVERFREIQSDPNVTIESFDSDVDVTTAALATSLQVRFFLRGLSGSLRLRFPKIRYKKEPKTPEEQVRRFYQLVDATVSAVLDADYYTHEPRTLDELSVDLGMFVDMVDLAPFREVMSNPASRIEFLRTTDFEDVWQNWQPHLRALDELTQTGEVSSHCSNIVRDLAVATPHRLTSILRACRSDARLSRFGDIAAGACCEMLQFVPAEHRASVESELVAWALDQPDDVWRVDLKSSMIHVGQLRLRLDDLSLDTIVSVLTKLLMALHSALMRSSEDVRSLLEQMHWCIEAVKALSPTHLRLPPSLRLIAEHRVPRSPSESARVLREPVASFADLDRALLEQFKLPAWPALRASITDHGVIVANDGIGAALGLSLRPGGILFGKEEATNQELAAGEEVIKVFPVGHSEATLRFLKLGVEYTLTLFLDQHHSESLNLAAPTSPAVPISRKRREAQRSYREQIDPNGLVIGSSPCLLRVFEDIHHANLLDGPAAVLILGEPGVGKTHIAELLHMSSDRANMPFRAVNAGGSGGDLNIQRGEWVGFGKGHGLTGIDAKGRPGHLQHAHGGTLFVDEFATMSSELQVIFLSILERRNIERVGGDSFTPDVRCIFATNVDIDTTVSAGTLRRDLVDRIGITIQIPPLRERRGDILQLARHFLRGASIDDRCLVALLRHEWPGNIRELDKVISLGVARAGGENGCRLSLEHCNLPHTVRDQIDGLDDADCRCELWHLADSIARSEGFEPGEGLQRRAAEIMGVNESQASKMYSAFGLIAAAAS